MAVLQRETNRTPTQSSTALELKRPHSNSTETAPQHKECRTGTQETEHRNTRNAAPERKASSGKANDTSTVRKSRVARYFYTFLYTFNNIKARVL